MADGEAFKAVCVYCGASTGSRPEYAVEARKLGEEIARRGMKLVYGGGSVGLMGEVSTAAFSAGGDVLGVIPKELEPAEVSGKAVGTVRVVADMHERKAAMAEASDAFIAMPGGFGTLEELMEMCTWQQLGYHRKPVGLLNINGFFDQLLAFFDHCVEEGFVRPSSRAIVVVGSTPAELLDKLQAYKAGESLISLAARGALTDNGQRG